MSRAGPQPATPPVPSDGRQVAQATSGLHRYTCSETLFSDGSTTLCRARDEDAGCSVLLKVLDPRHSRPVDLDRLRHEHDFAASLDLPGVVRTTALVTHEGMPALVSEDWGGEPLSRAFPTPMPLGRFLDLSVSVAAALGELHRHGIVHKDLKPPNIFVRPDTLEVKLGGLGLATRLPREQPLTLPPSLIEGSLPYMSPEQTGRTNNALDSRSDLYSLGVTFYELLTGRLPFAARDPLEWMHFHVARVPVPPSQIVADVPEVVAQIVTRLLAKATDDRYQTARGLQHDLARCRDEWLERGRVDPFPLGKRDLPDRLRFPQRLYGRDTELTQLVGALERVSARGESELVVVSGFSGTGKSTLVHQLEGPTLARGGLFASGKAEPHRVEVPYSTLAQAFGALVLRLSAGSEEQTTLWRERLRAALGPHGRLVADIIPQVEGLAGEQPRVPELGPDEARSRFRMVFHRFVGAFASEGRPLTLFLDDVQWIDSASLSVLQGLATDPGVRSVLLVGAYRESDVSPAHPLAQALDSMRGAGARFTSIQLGPLSHEAMTAFVADALHCPPPEAAPLAEVVGSTTGANPFFAIQFLSELNDAGLLHLDVDAGGWRWDLAALRERSFTDDVADLMVARLRRMDAPAQETLKQLALLGHTAKLSRLSWAVERSEARTQADLWGAVKEGLVVAAGDTYRFAHDRFWEAAYSLVAEEARPAQHLRLGRRLLAHLGEDASAEALFEAVTHVDRGLELIEDVSERMSIGRWNAVAGRRAKAAIAYASASAYLDRAGELLPPDAWRDRYDEAFDLFLERCECKFLSGDFAAGEALAGQLLERARRDPDRVRVHRLRIRMCELAGRNDEAMAIAGTALSLFGIRLPEAPEAIRAATEAEEGRVVVSLSGRRIPDLASAPEASSLVARAILGIIADSLSPAYMAQRGHFPLLAAMGVNVSLRDGRTVESSSVYNSYALVRAGAGDVSTAFDFSGLALRLLARVESPAARGIVLFRHGFFINHWRDHLSTSVSILRESDAACLDGGNPLYAGYARFAAIETAIEKGDSLDEILRAAEGAIEFATRTRSDAVRDTLRVQRQFVACLKGRTREPGSLDDERFSKAAGVAGFATWRLCVLEQAAAYLFGRYDVALEAAGRAEEALQGVVALMLVATHHFFRALTLAALYPTASDARRADLSRGLAEEVQRHGRWAEHGPANFANRHALLAAELACVEGRVLDAERLYEEAFRSARQHGFVQQEALSLELASRFYRARRLDLVADAYLFEARARYLRWGASGKVTQLEELHPQLVERRASGADAISGAFATSPAQLELSSVVRASQSISREIEIPKLVSTLLEIVLQQGGARRACLVLARGGALTIEAEAVLDQAGVRTRAVPSVPVSTSDLVPRTVVQRAQAMREPLVLGEAELRGRASEGDPYLAVHALESVLCLPILRGDELLGLVYLENDLLAGAFTPGRLTALSLLAAQVAISVENARLFSETQQAMVLQQRANERLRVEIEERRRAEAERLRAEEEVRELNQELERRVAERTTELAEANRELEAFAYSVSHDLRAPLRHIAGFSGLLERRVQGFLGEQERHYLHSISVSAAQMDQLVTDLLSFSRMGRAELARQPVDLAAVVEDVIKELSREAVGREVEWRVARLPVVTGDREMLRVVFVNLVSNALKFTGSVAHAVIEVGCRQDDVGTTVVFVRDNGVGFDMAYEKKLFGVFQRLHSADEFPGTGIGLANVRRVIARHGGRTWAEGAPSAGATFYVSLPSGAAGPAGAGPTSAT